jgi:hypothetical protein
MDHKSLELRSSAYTLSDMEVFIFPQLMYSLLLANIMSPRIWKWRDDPWFDGLQKMTPQKRIVRLKQYIMDHYVFNLDLDTWGLTTQPQEIARFRDFIDASTLAKSNALFGYEGDKYYFDIGIRQHFGLEKYDGAIIPYWKTETIEAMDAFKFKENYRSGAGECVSLSGLYAAALFVVAGVPLEDIYMMATPLHSQNFVDIGEGILTNNRRLVTRTMWFNGTELSAQARRALENENVTVVGHASGWIHTIYPEATIDRTAYEHFSTRLKAYLRMPLTVELLGNFLRQNTDMQKCFQLRWSLHGSSGHVGLDRVFAYERGSNYLATDKTRDKLMGEVDTEEFAPAAMQHRIVLNDLEAFIHEQRIDLDKADDVARLKAQFDCGCLNAQRAMEGLITFCHTAPRLPEVEAHRFTYEQVPLEIRPGMSREQILARLESIRSRNETADLAFHAYRDVNRTGAEAYLFGALRRSPVSIDAVAGIGEEDVVARIRALPDESIYDEPGRLAQPDEVWNFGRGDGVEKAVLLANILRARKPDEPRELVLDAGRAILRTPVGSYEFASTKGLPATLWPL